MSRRATLVGADLHRDRGGRRLRPPPASRSRCDLLGVRRAGVGGPKEQLLLAVLAYVDERALAALGNTVPTTTTRAAFQRWVEVARWAEGEGRTFVLLSARLEAEASAGPHPAREHFRQRDMAVRVMLAVMLHEGVGRGDLRADFDVEAKAGEMAAFGVGAQFMWMRDPDNVSLAQLYATYFADQYELLRQTRPRRRAAVRPSPAV